MPRVKTKDGTNRKEPYPVGEVSSDVIEFISRRMVYLMAVGQKDISGNDFSKMFADAIGGESLDSPLGIADVVWNNCCWSVKTIKNNNPSKGKKARLISGRNSPIYSGNISDPRKDIQATGKVVLETYNERILTARNSHSDIRTVVFIRNVNAGKFLIFERPISQYSPSDFFWKKNKKGNFEAFQGDRHAFTWQPHGSQFTIIDKVPDSAITFQISKKPKILDQEKVLKQVGFKPDWVKIG